MRGGRSAIFQIRMQPTTLERFKRLASTIGVPASTLAAMALGQFLAQQERNVQIIEQVATQVGAAGADLLRGPVADQMKLFSKAVKSNDAKPKR